LVDIFHYPFPLYRLFFCPANRVWGHKPILDIPADVLDHASAILEEAQALEEKWNRLMKV